MKIFQKIFITSFLVLAGAVPVFAQSQFSILPYTDKNNQDCKPIIDQFEKDQKMPSAADEASSKSESDKSGDLQKQKDADQKAASDAFAAKEKAAADLEAAQKKNDELKKCTGDPLSDGLSCPSPGELASKQKEASDAFLSAGLDKSIADNKFSDATDKLASDQKALDASIEAGKKVGIRANLLGCAIKTGRISLNMIPFFMTYIINFLLGMSGIITVLFIVIGGYHYVVGGLTEEKEKGKNTIMHALMGMGVALLAWTIVSVLLNAVTG